MEKIYEVEFMQYTNCMNDTVCDNTEELGKGRYLTVGREPFLIKESEFDKYMKYGNGFRIVRFVGNIEKEEVEPKKAKIGEWISLPVVGEPKYRCGNIKCCRGLPNGINPDSLNYCPYCGEQKSE